MASLFVKPWYLYHPTQAIRRIAQLGRRRPTTAVSKVAWGDRLEVNPSESIGAAIWRNAVYDIALSESIVRLLPAGGRAVDVGANLGYATCLMAKVVGAGGHVWTFEPNSQLRERLVRNVADNSYAVRTTLSFAAVSDRIGHASLIVPEGNAGNEGLAHLGEGPAAETVETVTLDNRLPDGPIDFLKIDVEGHEAAVIRGAAERIRHGSIRDIVFEEHGGRGAESIQLLIKAGYTLFELGWLLWGPTLSTLDQPTTLRPNEAPNYLATRDPDRATSLMRPRGFRCLRKL